MHPFVQIKRGKEGSLLRKHPWVFSGAIHKVSDDLQTGQVVDVITSDGTLLGKGHYQPGGSIVVRMLTFDDRPVDQPFWTSLLHKAYECRLKLGIIQEGITNAFRLIHGEGDNLPGLIIDVYDTIAVIQCHSTGMYVQRNMIARALAEVLPVPNLTIYCKAQDTLPSLPGYTWTDGFLQGNEQEVIILENGNRFLVNVVEGQKTGFFLDQRENRLLLSRYTKGKTVLNTFCYTGGFSVYALNGGASRVDSVDISGKAMALTDENIRLNPADGMHTSHVDNVIPYLQNQKGDEYDIVIVDPPAFAKSMAKRHNAVQAYKRLNAAALSKVKSGGLLFTFSCSQVVTTQLFYDTIVAAGLEAGRSARVIQHLSQGGDHPVNLFHPEGHYLKGLLLYVD
jgi:23S rRNA (cytosine1962-C5)-methyltransferase